MKKRLKIFLLCLVLALTVLGVAANFFAPDVLYKSAVHATRFSAGLESKKIKVDGHTYAYLDTHPEGSELPVLVGLHGFSGDKDNWARMAVFLRGKYRIIAVDMLGHGDSDKPLDASYALSEQAKRIHAILQKLGVRKFHLMGNSMGGQTAGLYASIFPEDVASVIFVDNAGVTPLEKSIILKKYEATGQNDLLVEKPEDILAYFDAIFTNPPLMTKQIELSFGEHIARDVQVYKKIFQDFVFNHPEPLEALLPNMHMPVQIIWGDEDKVLHVSSVNVMSELLDTEQVHIFKGVGHAPMVEVPKQTANVIHQFVRGVEAKNAQAVTQ